MSSGPFKKIIYKMCLEITYLIYMYKQDLALYNLQWFICHKTKPNQTQPTYFAKTEVSWQIFNQIETYTTYD